EVAPPLKITTTSPLSPATVGKPYSASLSASGGTAPYSWSLVWGSLPTGLKLNASTGAITGTPTGASTSFTVQVRDTKSTSVPATSATAQFSILLVPPIVTVSTGGYTGWTVYGGNRIWALSAGNGTVTEVQPFTGAKLATY